jgi:alkylation response protein AidB-like acyl-CoA dehydrogenase
MGPAYHAPLRDMRFALRELAPWARLQALPAFAGLDDDTVDAVLEECARLVQAEVAPLNVTGDRQPPSWQEDGSVRMPPGFREALAAYAGGGWQGLMHPAEHGGQGLPRALATPCLEMLQSASLAFSLCPLLTDGAIEALLLAGSPEQQARWVPALIEGRWTGTMNLTEPQAGSDLAQVRTRAEPQADGRYRLFGQKIFITFGEHDLADNILHLVLARVRGAPEGVKGLTLFAVPKCLPGPGGEGALRNDVRCTALEHKLGIHGSPTAVLVYGEGAGDVGPGALAERVGEENRGLELMFIMMNAARFQVGLQGVAIGERALQQARAFAGDRVQGRAAGAAASAAASAGSTAPILAHPDVRRLLMRMRCQVEAGRALAVVTAAWADLAHHEPDAAERARCRARQEFLVPIVKGWNTEASVEVASLGVQVHGGMGYIEETGAAQHLRDARILPIYEGTTAIQANDLLGRKTLRDGGAVAREFLADVLAVAAAARARPEADLQAVGRLLDQAGAALGEAVDWMLAHAAAQPARAHAGAVPYLMLCGHVLGGALLGRSAVLCAARLAAGEGGAFERGKIATARFFAEHLLAQAPALAGAIASGGAGVLDFPDELN